MYTAVARRCTRSVHAVNGRAHSHIHGTYTAVHTGRKHGRLHGRKHGRVHGHGRTMYMARARPCTQSVHGRGRPCTDCSRPPSAVYKLCTRPYTGHAHGSSVSRTRPYTSRYVAKHGRVRGPYPTVYVPYVWPCTGRVPCTRSAVYRVRGRLHGRLYGPCARPCKDHVHGRAWSVHYPNTAVFTARVHYTARKRPCTADGHDSVYGPCTRLCTVYMHVFVACVYGRPLPCTDCVRAMYMVRS